MKTRPILYTEDNRIYRKDLCPPKTKTCQKLPPPKLKICLVSSDILLSLAALPLLGGLLAAKAAAEFVGAIGVESEEVFRGSRLPVLNFPHGER
ncbi:MAG: hypothetical protein HC942_08680 [Microcoleus sp. SU_5_6]|nr:hypothetical protein [Microcoleus sp. SU_5_6]